MTIPSFTFGMTNEELFAAKTIYAEDLLVGRRILVSGGGSGIGKAIAWLLARLGAEIIICGRNEDKLSTAVAAMTGKGLKVSYRILNIRDPESVGKIFADIFADKPIDILINNAGGQFPQPAIDYSVNGWKSVIDTNLNGTWFMMQAAAQRWRDTGKAGNIINIVAVIDRGIPDLAHTCAARAGVVYLSKSVAVEWAQYAIRVNCIAPGVIDSEGMKVYPDKAREKFYLSNPMKKPGSIWDIAQAAAYLASDAANFTTGEVMTLDGGGRHWGELWAHDKPDYFKN